MKMKKNKIKFLYFIPVLILFSVACNDYVSNVEPLITQAQDNLLNTEQQVPFLALGVKQQFANIASQLAGESDMLSDQVIYTSDIPTASFPQFEEIDKGLILTNNASVTNLALALGPLRFYADDLVRRIGTITFTSTTVKNDGLFTGNLYGGYARYLMAVNFGLNPTQPGNTIDAGPFIAQSDLLNQAIDKLKSALTYASKPTDTRIVNSLIAKAYLAKSDYANAAIYAAQGMAKGDAEFDALYSSTSQTWWWGFAGNGRVQAGVNSRFHDYITADPNEANRIKINTVKGTSGATYYYQIKYPNQDSPMPVMTWQENNLMLAELILRGNATGDPLALVNDVRSSHSIGPLAVVTTDVVMVERDKELFCQGTRLVDQNRTGNWHLAAGTWHYLPIPDRERLANPNLH